MTTGHVSTSIEPVGLFGWYAYVRIHDPSPGIQYEQFGGWCFTRRGAERSIRRTMAGLGES